VGNITGQGRVKREAKGVKYDLSTSYAFLKIE
jgi:hypothetical protein